MKDKMIRFNVKRIMKLAWDSARVFGTVEGFLGEPIVPISESPFAAFSVQDWIIRVVEQYGQIDGEHHKAWVLDQIARIAQGAEITVRKAFWANGTVEWRYEIGSSPAYESWTYQMKQGGYTYDPGIAP